LQAILSIHNRYQQPGGEDRVFAAEAALLESRGHRVARYTDSNARISNGFAAGLATVWNQTSYRRLRAAAEAHSPEIAHFHNTFPLISPAAYYALRRQRVPVVQTLSNFRLVCPGSLLLRDGKPCEECLERNSLRPALRHRCYRESFTATAAVCGMIAAHRAAGTWDRAVDAYIALSDFARARFIEGGLPENRIVVKRNFLAPDPGVGEGRGGYALFVGRLSAEKGINTLVDAWRRQPGMPLRVAGDGPLNTTEWPPGVEWLGQQSQESVLALMKNAAVLVFPSICYENAPLTILEAFACGLPVVASNIGSIPELVTDHLNGLLFRAGNADDLARQVRWASDHPERMREMRAAARREYETKYTAAINYKRLIEIYELAVENARRARNT
jgi:glycosyltransferase involved in cell wall biosynthesis